MVFGAAGFEGICRVFWRSFCFVGKSEWCAGRWLSFERNGAPERAAGVPSKRLRSAQFPKFFSQKKIKTECGGAYSLSVKTRDTLNPKWMPPSSQLPTFSVTNPFSIIEVELVKCN